MNFLNDFGVGLLSLDDKIKANQMAQAELDARMNRSFGLLDYATSPDPYAKILLDSNIPDRYSPDSFPGGVVSGLNSAKDYIAGAFTGQNRINHQLDRNAQNQAILQLPSEQQEQAIAENAILNGLDWVGGATIGGKLAKNADLGLLKKAQDMKSQGLLTDDIYTQTKWWLDHPDGKPRFEIDDSGFNINEAYLMPPKQRMLTDLDRLKKQGKENEAWALERENRDLSDFGDYSISPNIIGSHRELNSAYPDVMNKMITPNSSISSQGSFDGNGYGLSVFADNPKSTLSHEFQHAVQKDEGFSRGGNPDIAQKIYYDNLKNDFTDKGYGGLISKDYRLSEDLTPLREAESINHFLNINQPRQLFNTSDYYEMSDELRTHLGPPPKRNQLHWAQQAGELIAIRKMDTANYEVKDIVKNGIPSDVKRQIKNLESKRNRLYNKGLLDAKSVQADMRNHSPSQQLSSETKQDLYEKIGGESEARLVQDRMDMPMDERLTNPFYKNYDTPFNEMIIRQGDSLQEWGYNPE